MSILDLTGSLRPWPDQVSTIWRNALAISADVPDYWHTPPYLGLPKLRAWFGTALEVDPNRVVITAGIRSAVPLLVTNGSHVLLEAPTFLGIQRVLEQTGHSITLLSWNDLTKRPAHRGDVVWVTSPGRNPDGACLTENQARSLEAWAACGGHVIVNETYRWACRPPFQRPAGASIVVSMAKVFGPGARLGAVVLSSALEEPRDRERLAAPPTGWQLAWYEFLHRGSLDLIRETVLEPVWALLDVLRPYLARRLGLELLADGPNLLIPLPANLNEAVAVAAAERVGVRIGYGANFGSQVPSVRLCFSGTETLDATDVFEALERMICAWERLTNQDQGQEI